MAPKSKPKQTGQVDMIEPFVRGRAAVKSFFDELEKATDVPSADLKRILDGLQKIAVRGLKSKGKFTIPAVGVFRLAAKPSASEGPMVIMGKTLARRERPAESKVICKVAAVLNDKVIG